MELDLRGSVLCEDTVKESGKGQRLTELVVHRALGINSKATTEDNLNGFRPMTEETEHKFTREDIEVWLRILSVRGRCTGLGERAEAYAYKFVEEDKLNNGWLWLTEEKEYWLQNMKRAHYIVLEKYGFARKDTLSHWGTSVTPVKARGLSAPPVKARDQSATPVKHDKKMNVKQQEQHDPVDVSTESGQINVVIKGMTNAEQTHVKQQEDPVEDSTVSEKINEVTKGYHQGCSEGSAGDGTQLLTQMQNEDTNHPLCNASLEMCADGSDGGGSLEEQMTSLQKIVDEMRAGDGTLEALKQGILNRRKITGEGTMALQEYEVSTGGSTGSTGTPEGRREGISSMCDGGNGANMIGTDPTAEENSVARELMIDPGGGDNIYAGGGKLFYPEITGKWRRNNPGGGHNAPARGGRIKDPGGGENIDIGGSPTDFEKCVDPLVNNEVPRKLYEVKEIKNHRSTKADAAETSKRLEEKANQMPEMANKKETRKEEPKKFVKERAENEVICGG